MVCKLGFYNLHQRNRKKDFKLGFKLFYCNFACSTNPFFKRGGHAGNGEAAGVFASNNTTGEPNENNSFRAALVPSV